MAWKRLIIEPGEREPEPLEQALFAAGAVSVSLEGAGEEALLEPAPGTTPVWRKVRVSALFPQHADLDLVRSLVAAQLGGEVIAASRDETLAERDWQLAWLEDFHPMRFGERLWVCPADRRPDDPAAVVVQLAPGLAFGTGTHPTTAACLSWLDAQPLADLRVLDYGCGSGILALAALRLGAARATGVDNDPQARSSTRENARRNGLAGRIVAVGPERLAAARYDVVLANILAGPLIALAPIIAALSRPGTALALAGVLTTQAPEVARHYARWFALGPAESHGEWALLHGCRLPEDARDPRSATPTRS